MCQENKTKEAIICKDSTGYWKIIDKKTGERVGGFQDTELQAFNLACWHGYLVS